MVLYRAEDPQLHIRQRTDREWNAPGHQVIDQCWVLETPHAVVDTRYAQQRERFADVRRPPLFAGMRDGQESFLTCACEDCRELRRWIADFRRIGAHRHEPISVWQRRLEGLHGGLRSEMPQEAGDQAAGDRAVAQSRRNAVDDGGERDPPPGVRLRVEEDLGMTDVVGG